MFANPEIPIGMANPSDIEIVLKSETGIDIGAPQQFVKDDAIINPFDAHFPPIAFVK